MVLLNHMFVLFLYMLVLILIKLLKDREEGKFPKQCDCQCVRFHVLVIDILAASIFSYSFREV